jgi:hypothetical protein
MSYDDFEKSTDSSQPIELYHFMDDDGHHWRYTSHAEAQTFLSYEYTPDIIHREKIMLADNNFKNEVQITLGRGNDFALTFLHGLLESKIILEIYRLQDTTYITCWSGIVHRIEFDKDEIPTVRSSPISTEIVRAGARRRCQMMCDLPLYSPYCTVNRAVYTMAGVLTNVSGVTLSSGTFSTQPNDWLRGGMIIVGYARRLIQWHQGSQIKITRAIPNIAAGASFTAFAGCGHTPADCLNKFNNKANYGGAEFLPVENPFTTPVTY